MTELKTRIVTDGSLHKELELGELAAVFNVTEDQYQILQKTPGGWHICVSASALAFKLDKKNDQADLSKTIHKMILDAGESMVATCWLSDMFTERMHVVRVKEGEHDAVSREEAKEEEEG